MDDNRDSSDLVSLMLYNSDNSYSVTAISTAEVALSIMENQTFDVYILDYWLREMSGIELCQKIRQTDKRTPFVFFTAMARSTDYAEGIKACANGYLVKPNELEILPKTEVLEKDSEAVKEINSALRVSTEYLKEIESED